MKKLLKRSHRAQHIPCWRAIRLFRTLW